jgi:hypothetical protein
MYIDFGLRRELPKGQRVADIRSQTLHSIPLEISKSSSEYPDTFYPFPRESALGVLMKRINLAALRFFALLLLLPGLGGLVFSAMVSTRYLENLPKSATPAEERTIPRNIHGTVVYQTLNEDKTLSAMEYGSISVFLVGLLLGIVYLEKWSSVRQLEGQMDTDLLEEVGV